MFKSKRIINYILNVSHTYKYIPILSSKFVRYSSNRENVITRSTPASTDILLQSLKTAYTPKNVLELVGSHHKIMNNKHAMQALRSLFSLQKSGNSNVSADEIIVHPHFKTLCLCLKSQIRSIDLNETIEALKIVSYVGIPSNSTITQILLQLIRYNINNLSLYQIIFLDFLIKQFQNTPLSDALLIALPIVFEVNLPMKIEKENTSHLVDFLQYISRKQVSESTINLLIDILVSQKYINVKEATSIIWSLCDLKPQESFVPLLEKSLKIIKKEGHTVKMSDLETTLTKLTSRWGGNCLFYYDDKFFNLVADNLIDHDMGFQHALWILQKFNKVGHYHKNLLDYIAKEVHKDMQLVSEASFRNLYTLITGFSNANYKSLHWVTIKKAITENCNYKKGKNDTNWIKFSTKLAILDIYIPDILQRAFSYESISKTLQNGNYDNCMDFLTLYQALCILYPENKKYLPPSDYIDKVKDKFYAVNLDEYPLQGALEKAFGGTQYILTNCSTKFGHQIQHAVVMRKGGYPIACNSLNEDYPIILEDLNVPTDSQIVIILGLSSWHYKINVPDVRGITSLAVKTLESSGYPVVTISLDAWFNIPDYEKIPYVMRLVKEKCEETEKVLAEQ